MGLARAGCVALLLVLTACWGGSDDGPPVPSGDEARADASTGGKVPPEVGYPDVVRRARDLTHRDLAHAPGLESELPSRVEFPPKGEVAQFVDDPPGRAVMSIVNYGPVSDPSARGWDSYTWYFYGRDGRWRGFNLGGLGLPDSAQYDMNVKAALSPDGRYGILLTGRGLLVVDMATAEILRVGPKRDLKFAGGGKWTPDGLIAMGFSGRKNSSSGVFIDPETGNLRPWHGPSIYLNLGLDYDWDGTPVLALWGDGWRTLGFRFFGSDGRVERKVRLPWVLRGRFSAHFSKHRIAFYRQAMDNKRLQHEGAFIVTDREGVPQHILLTGDNSFDVHTITWLDRRTLLLETPRDLVAWRPDEKKFYHLTRIDERPTEFFYSIATELVRPERSR